MDILWLYCQVKCDVLEPLEILTLEETISFSETLSSAIQKAVKGSLECFSGGLHQRLKDLKYKNVVSSRSFPCIEASN